MVVVGKGVLGGIKGMGLLVLGILIVVGIGGLIKWVMMEGWEELGKWEERIEGELRMGMKI